ncbi:MAG TPA: enoyl-CoA hydratase/isomerase family protein, partial [Burkholderiales bacterium]|nr:enoyl-CoA hydratase/isomerase family protein [Burkholderiales bacterium]
MTLPAYQTLALESRDEHLLVVTLSRPQVLNALNTQMGRDKLDLWTRLTADPGSWRCVVLTGAGERAFCAGADLKERDGMSESVWRAQHEI